MHPLDRAHIQLKFQIICQGVKKILSGHKMLTDRRTDGQIEGRTDGGQNIIQPVFDRPIKIEQKTKIILSNTICG